MRSIASRDGPPSRFVPAQLRCCRRAAPRERMVRVRARRLHRRGPLQAGSARDAADGGTVLLDEVGELPHHPPGQAPVRVVEERAVMRVGGVQAATHRRAIPRGDAPRSRGVEIGRGTFFRQDLLYFRLNGVTLHVPPLRERPRGDPFARERLHRRGRQPKRSAEEERACTAPGRPRVASEGFAWPGNVRELRNVVERAVLLVRPAIPSPSAISLTG